MKKARSAAEVSQVKDAVLACALGMLVDGGFQGLTMRGLAVRLGMTAPNLYNYFADKDEIYITLMTRGFAELSFALTSAVQGVDDPEEAARAAMRRYVRFGLEQRSYYELMFSSAMPKHREFVGTAREELSAQEHKLSMQVADFARDILMRVSAARGEPVDVKNAELVLTTVWSLLHGAVSLAHSQNLAYLVTDVGAVVDSMIERITGPAFLSVLAADA